MKNSTIIGVTVVLFFGVSLLSLTPLETRLFQAAIDGDVDNILSLAGYGVNVDAVTENTQSPPLFCAIYYNHVFCVLALLGAKAQMTLQDISGNTALHKAACYGYLQLCKILLINGALLEVRNKADQTAEQLARECGNHYLAHFLAGVRQKGISVLDEIEKKQEELCPLCCESFAEGRQLVTFDCGHDVCLRCIEKEQAWALAHNVPLTCVQCAVTIKHFSQEYWLIRSAKKIS